jgi:hypothetical protein
MERRILGCTGLEVTQLSYGAMEIRVAATGPLPQDVYAEAKRRLAAVGEQPAGRK